MRPIGVPSLAPVVGELNRGKRGIVVIPAEGIEQARIVAREAEDILLAYDHVFGFGVGERTTGGERTGEVGLVVYVDRKLPAESLRSGQLLPRSIEAGERTALVDVVERARPQFGVDDAQYRPLVGGIRITAAGGGTGTLGAVMYDRTDASTVLLTCNHVLTPAGQRGAIPASTRVSQPFMAGVGDTKRIVPWLPPPLGVFGAQPAGTRRRRHRELVDADVDDEVPGGLTSASTRFVPLPAVDRPRGRASEGSSPS